MTTNNGVNVGLSGATGTGNFVGATSPTLTNPVIAAIKGTNGFNIMTFADSASTTDYFSVISNVANSAAIQLVSSNTNGSCAFYAKGNGGVQIGANGGTTTNPLSLYSGSNTFAFSVPTWTSNRTLTFPDANVTLVSGTMLASGGALGTPSSGTLTNCTGYPSGNLVNGGYVLLGSVTASNQASVAFTSLSGSSYSQYVIIINNVLLATAAQNLTLQISTGSGLLTTNYSYASWRWTTAANGQGGGTAQSAWAVNSNGETLGNTVNTNEASFKVSIFGANSIVPIRSYTSEGYYKANSANLIATMQQGQVLTNAAAIDGMQFASTSGNITSGNFYLYGIKNS